MTFLQDYRVLEGKFKDQVGKDNERFGWKGKEASYYLPTIPPKAPVDFVLIVMEPSTAKAADGTHNVARNLYASVGDFILHFCARNYLCEDGQSYFITDLAKGAMSTNHAKSTASKRWPEWYPLLRQELKLVSKPRAPVIAVGRRVYNYLKKRRTPRLRGSLLHFSNQASLARTIAPQLMPRDYQDFAKNVGANDLVCLAEELTQAKAFDRHRDQILENLRKTGGTESSKQLMFTYKALFAVMKGVAPTE